MKIRFSWQLPNLIFKSLSNHFQREKNCLVFKSKQYCQELTAFEKKEFASFIVKKNPLLKNKDNQEYLCNICLKDIRKGKVPVRNKKKSFPQNNFPVVFFETLKRRCHFKEKSGETVHNKATYDHDFFKLNRLESYILKLTIPFLRVGYCPRGRYLKLRGDLILISADIVQSLGKILPLDQKFIPVSFKRRLSYSGFYLEEFVEIK